MDNASEVEIACDESLNTLSGEEVFLAFRLEINADALGADTITMLVNPDLSSPNWADPLAIVASKNIGVPDKIATNSMGDTVNRFGWDEIRMGTTWADVAPYVPEPATLFVLALGSGLALLRRRK